MKSEFYVYLDSDGKWKYSTTQVWGEHGYREIVEAETGEQAVEIAKRTRRLTCCCCGESLIGRQWFNRDTGYGICNDCAEKQEKRETPENMKSYYGIKGIHYSVK